LKEERREKNDVEARRKRGSRPGKIMAASPLTD
jgi:hypothetical protein